MIRRCGRRAMSYPHASGTRRVSRCSERLSSGFTWSDFFCGAGGSSIGLTGRLGLKRRIALGSSKKGPAGELVVAANHWRAAVDTHEANFPDTLHVCADLSDPEQTQPRNFPWTDGAWFSPECTWMTNAHGVKMPTRQQYLWTQWEPEANEQAERSRATMGDVIRFTAHHHYRYVIVENVIEILRWPAWESWWREMTEVLGYHGRKVFLNSMFCHPTPQSRDRLYCVFWRKDMPAPGLNITPVAYCPRCERQVAAVQSWKPGRSAGKYRAQYVYCCPLCAREVTPFYHCAANAVDWSQPIERIGDRRHPLKPKTLERIQRGLEKYGRNPLMLVANHRGDGTVRLLARQPLPTQTTGSTPAFLYSDGAWDNVYRALDQEMPALTSSRTLNLVVPWIMEVGHGGPENDGRIKAITDALPTEHTLGGIGMALTPYLVPLECSGGSDHRAYPATEMFHTQSTRQATGLVLAPYLVDAGGVWESGEHAITGPYPTQSTRRQPGLALAPFLTENHGGGSYARDIIEPMHTVIAGGNHHGLVLAPHAFLTTYNGESVQDSILDPAATMTTIQRHGLTIPDKASFDASLPAVEDCYYRTLKRHEIQRGMAFPDDYAFPVGDQRAHIKMLGNAVTPPVAEELGDRCTFAIAS